MKEIMNAQDFMWYQQELDVLSRYEHRHNGKPEKYPCVVMSSFWDDPNGPYTYDHNFIYKQEEVCCSCGHKEMKYPLSKEQLDELKGD